MKRFVLGLFFLLPVFVVKANTIDSLRIVLEYQVEDKERLQTLYALSRAYLIEGDTTGLSFWELGFEIAEQSSELNYVADFYYLRGYFERGFLFHHAEAFVSLSLAKEVYEKISNYRKIAFCTLLIAEYYSTIEEYEIAENLYLEAEINLLRINDLTEIGRLHEHLGFLFKNKGEVERSIDEFTIASSYYNKAQSWDLLTATVNNLGKMHRENDAYAQAKLAFERALHLAKEKSTSPIDHSFAAFNLAWVSWEEDKSYPAENQLLAAYHVTLEHQPGHTETFRMADLMADFYWDQGQTAKALELLATQAAYMPENPNETQLLVYHQLVRLYRATEQWELALATSEKLMSKQVAAATALAQAGHARQTSEIALAQKMLAGREEEEAYSRAEMQWIWACIGIATILLGFAGYVYRIKEKHRKKALANATHWPELDKRMQALEDALNVLY